MRNRELVIYKHQKLMSEYNEMMIVMKKALYLNGEKPDIKQIDELQDKIFEVLKSNIIRIW